jgi:hypothetical protein
MLTSGRVLFGIAALVALGTADAPAASPIHRCHQHGCKAHETWQSDFDAPHSAQFLAVFEPGKGILGGPCGLPSSGCTDMVN